MRERVRVRNGVQIEFHCSCAAPTAFSFFTGAGGQKMSFLLRVEWKWQNMESRCSAKAPFFFFFIFTHLSDCASPPSSRRSHFLLLSSSSSSICCCCCCPALHPCIINPDGVKTGAGIIRIHSSTHVRPAPPPASRRDNVAAAVPSFPFFTPNSSS